MPSKTKPPITRDPETHSGAPVFSGTRIAVKVLFDYLADGQSVDAFLRHYPSLSRAQAVAALVMPARSSAGIVGNVVIFGGVALVCLLIGLASRRESQLVVTWSR